MPSKEMPIFTRTFDLLAWLLPMTNHFPRAHRQTLTKRLIDAAFDLRECLEHANVRRRDDRRRALHAADEALARLRVYLQLAQRMGWMNDGQFGHVSTMVAEVWCPHVPPPSPEPLVGCTRLAGRGEERRSLSLAETGASRPGE